MASERWSPFEQFMSLRQVMDRLLEESLVPPAMALRGARRADSGVPIDLADAGHAYVLSASLPGVDPEHLRVTVQGDVVTLQGEPMEPEPPAGWRWLLRERPTGTLSRTVRLPEPIDADRAEAELVHGRLTLTLPKQATALPQRIRVGEPESALQPQSQADRAAADAEHKDLVTQGSEESFPASDAPSWTPERA